MKLKRFEDINEQLGPKKNIKVKNTEFFVSHPLIPSLKRDNMISEIESALEGFEINFNKKALQFEMTNDAICQKFVDGYYETKDAAEDSDEIEELLAEFCADFAKKNLKNILVK